MANPDQSQRQGRAVVVGASMSGLLAARVLARHYELVTVIERDALPEVGENRKAVPQGRHAHVLLGSGQLAIEDLLPGVTAEILTAGGAVCRAFQDIRFIIGGHELTRDAVGADVLLASRPLIEGVVRRRTLEADNIQLVHADATGLASDGYGLVTGVHVCAHGETEVHPADVVVAASGRGGQVPAWLEQIGCAAPPEERLHIGVTYVSRPLRIRAGALGGDRLVLIGAKPGLPRGLTLIEQENGTWICTLSGYGSEHRPPADEPGYLDFLASVAPREVVDAVAAADALGDFVRHGFPDNRRRRYDRLRPHPEGLVVVGDAVCSFNPLYGQGMSVAALQAVALGRCLEADREGLTRRALEAITKVVALAWSQAVGGDLALPEVDGRRSWDVRLVNAYLERVLRASEHDPVVAAAFSDVSDLLAPPQHILRPAVLWRVLRGQRTPARPRPLPEPAARCARDRLTRPRPQSGRCSLSHADLRAADARDNQASCTTSTSSS
jgi:2-polyprenyl-6-methoxyphenol hydroxylase-like FAD-dependent oxidoreductase